MVQLVYLIVMLYLELIAKVVQLVHVLLVKVGMVWLMAIVINALILIHNVQVAITQDAQVVVAGMC